MKGATQNRAGSSSALVKKVVVKKAPAKAEASNPSSTEAPKKEGISPSTAATAQEPEIVVDLKTDSMISADTPVEPTDNKDAAFASMDGGQIAKAGVKPKTRTVIVKRKVIVKKKKSSASAGSSTTEPVDTSNPMSSYTDLKEAKQQPEPEDANQQPDQTVAAAEEVDAVKEAELTSLRPEKRKKVVKKVIVVKKGGLKEVKKDNKPDEVAKHGALLSTGQSGSFSKVALPQNEEDKEAGNTETHEVHEHEKMDMGVEALELGDDQEFQEQPVYGEEFPEDDEAQIGDEHQSRTVSERLKRKKLEVFVGGLDKDATEDDVRVAFKPVGDVAEVRLMMNPVTGKNKGYAFVRFATAEQAVRAATELSTTRIRGKECGVLPNQDNDTLFIGNISKDWKSSEVLQKLEEYGITGIEGLTLMTDPNNEALNRGYAFLELATHYDAVNAFQRLQRPGVMFGYDRPARVSWAQPFIEPDDSVMSQVKSVFVDGIPPDWTDEIMLGNFGKFGEIERIVFARNMPYAKRQDFAFVNYTSRESARACAEALRDAELFDGDRKVKLKVSLSRKLHKGKADGWNFHRGYSGQGRGHAGRGEGYFPSRFCSRGRGFGRTGSRGMVGRGGKRLYNEDEVRMLLEAVREEEGWTSRARGRGTQNVRASRGRGRGEHGRNDDNRHYDGRRPEEYRQQTEADYAYEPYSGPASDAPASRGKVFRHGAMRDDYEHQPSSRSRAAHPPQTYMSPGTHHNYESYEEGSMHGHDYYDGAVGEKRPVSVLMDEDPVYYESSRRGYPRARADYASPGPLPENVTSYSSHIRSPAGSAAQGLSMRQGRPSSVVRDPLYYGGSGYSKVAAAPTYEDYNYNALHSSYLAAAPERRETSMYPPSLYGGSAGYDLQNPGYY